ERPADGSVGGPPPTVGPSAHECHGGGLGRPVRGAVVAPATDPCTLAACRTVGLPMRCRLRRCRPPDSVTDPPEPTGAEQMLCPSPFPAVSAQALSIATAPHPGTGPISALATAPAVAPVDNNAGYTPPPNPGELPAVAPDRHIASYSPLPTPGELLAELPLTAEAAHRVAAHRQQVRAVLDGSDDRLLVVVGPCSIHDPVAGLDYARRLAALRDELQD